MEPIGPMTAQIGFMFECADCDEVIFMTRLVQCDGQEYSFQVERGHFMEGKWYCQRHAIEPTLLFTVKIGSR